MGFSSLPKGLGDQRVNLTIQAFQQEALEQAQELTTEQLTSMREFRAQMEEAINPFASKYATRQKDLKNHRQRVQKGAEAGEKSKRLLPIEQIKKSAEQFSRRNPELRAQILVALRENIKPDDTMEDILRKVLEFYPDVTLADEALEFLLETTEGELARQVQLAKDKLNEEQGREITAGRNVSIQARQAAETGIGTPTSLRGLYRDITGNPRDSTILFDELSQKYAFKDLKKVMDFLLHSLGSDMKSKGPSIPRAELHRLLTETRSLQAILGVYRFFKGRMRLLTTLFQKNSLSMPAQVNFEQLAKQFMSLAGERYPSSDKVLNMASKLGIEKWILAKIFVFSVFRDAVREVAMYQIYKTLQHRDELYLAILEALEDLEDALEEEEEELLKREEEKEESEEEGEGDREEDSIRRA